MKNFSICQYICGRRSRIYTIQFEGEIQTEFNKFLESFKYTHLKELRKLTSKIDVIANNTGAREIFFDLEEGKLSDSLCRFKGTGQLRLYCLRFGQMILVLGGGGIKNAQTYQEIAELNRRVIELQKIDKLIYERIKNSEIEIDDDMGMVGNLNFIVE